MEQTALAQGVWPAAVKRASYHSEDCLSDVEDKRVPQRLHGFTAAAKRLEPRLIFWLLFHQGKSSTPIPAERE